MPRPLTPRTRAVHAGARRSQYGELSEAMFLTQGFAYPDSAAAERRFADAQPDEFVYARYGNPTVAIFEERLATLEGAEDCFATASGMAAVNGALCSMLRAGDHIVSSRALFGSCLYIVETLLPRFGVEVTLVDGRDLGAWEAAMRPSTKACFFETLSNPVLEVVDIAGVAEIAHRHGAMCLVDNVFSVATLSKTFELGADAVIYSATKHIDGQGRVLGGAILGSRDFIRTTVEPYMKHTGGSLSPFNAWVLLKGLETLDLRGRAQAASAEAAARALQGHNKLSRVVYPGLPDHPGHAVAMRQMETGGTIVAIDVIGGKDAAFRVLDGLEVFLISNNLGDAKSIATHPATTTHSRLSPEARAVLGISDGTIRLSFGLEHPDDLITDLRDALAAA